MLSDSRVEILQLVVWAYSHDAVAKFLHVPAAQLQSWLLGTTALPDPILASLRELVDPSPTRH